MRVGGLTYLFVLLALCSFSNAFAQGVEIETIGRVPLDSMKDRPIQGNDIWGYTDAQGRDYALLGSYTGIHAFDLQDPTAPREIDAVPFVESRWKDIKTFKYDDGRAYAFVVSDGANSPGLMVLDLNQLPERMPLVATHPFFTAAHNIFISPDNDSPYAYVAITGSNQESGLHIIDIADPLEPKVVHHYKAHGVHDLYSSKHWASPAFDGRELVVLFSEDDGIVTLDVNDKTNPRKLSQLKYNGLGYSHSGWADRRGRYIYACDEFDELNDGVNTTIYIIDLIDPENPVQLPSWIGPTTAVDHNAFTLGNELYMSNYTAGVTVLDITQPTAPVLSGNHNPFGPHTGDPSTDGFWGIYPYFDGYVIASHIDEGLVVMKIGALEEPTLVYTRELSLCPGDNTALEESITLLGPIGPNQPVSLGNLPAGLEASIDQSTIDTGQQAKYQLRALSEMAPGTYPITIHVGDLTASIEVTVIEPKVEVTLRTPYDGQKERRPDSVYLRWRFDRPDGSYEVSLWTQEDRSDAQTYLTTDPYIYIYQALEPNTRYFWQVQGTDGCATDISEVRSFVTGYADVLLVDSSTLGLEINSWAYGLVDQGITFAYEYNDGSTFTNAANHKLVIWVTGENPLPALSAAEEEQLINYVNNGGHLVICSKNYYSARGSTISGLPQQILGVTGVDADIADFTNLQGQGDWAYIGSGTLAGDTDPAGFDHLTADRGSAEVLINPETDHVAGVLTPNTFYMSMPLYFLEEQSRDMLLKIIAELFLRTNGPPEPTMPHKTYVALDPTNYTFQGNLRIINPHNSSNQVKVVAVKEDGREVGGVTPTLAANGHTDLSMAAISSGIALDYSYIMITSEQPVVAMLEGIDTTKAYAVPATDTLTAELSIPHIAADTASFYTYANIANGTPESVEVELQTSDGTWDMAANDPYSGTFVDFEVLMDAINANRTSAVVTATKDGAPEAVLTGVELFGAKNVSQLAGLSLNGQAGTTLVFSHLASVANGWWTGIAAANPSTESAQVTYEVYDSGGNVLVSGDLIIPAQGKLLDYIIDGYRGENTFGDGIPVEGVWLKLTSDLPLVGYELFSDSAGRLLAGFGASVASATELVMPFVGSSERYAGIALVNDQAEAQEVTFDLYNSQGQLQTTVTETIAPRARFLTTGSSLFGSHLNKKATHAVVRASNGVHGFTIYGDNDVNWLAALLAQPISTP